MLWRRKARPDGPWGEGAGAAEHEGERRSRRVVARAGDRRARGRMPSARGGRVATTVSPRSAASSRPCRTAVVSRVEETKGAAGLTMPLRLRRPRPRSPPSTAACTCTPTAARAVSSAASVRPRHRRCASAPRHRHPRRSVALGCARSAALIWASEGPPSAGVQRARAGAGDEEGEAGDDEEEHERGRRLLRLPAWATPVAPLRIR